MNGKIKYVKLNESDKSCDLYLLTINNDEQYLCTKDELFSLALDLMIKKGE